MNEAFEERATNDGTFEALFDPAGKVRRQRVLAMLEKSPGIKYALITDVDSDPDSVLLTLAIRGKATCEFQIPRDRYDGFLLLDLSERHRATHH